MLKTVGTSGQLAVGKKLAGRTFEMEVRPDGSIVLAPVTITKSTTTDAKATRPAKQGRPRFHVFKVEQFELPAREARHSRERSRG